MTIIILKMKRVPHFILLLFLFFLFHFFNAYSETVKKTINIQLTGGQTKELNPLTDCNVSGTLNWGFSWNASGDDCTIISSMEVNPYAYNDAWYNKFSVTGKATGDKTLKCFFALSWGGSYKDIIVEYKIKVTSSLIPEELSINVGDNYKITPQGSSVTGVNWSSSNTSVVSIITQSPCVIHGQSAGTSTVTLNGKIQKYPFPDVSFSTICLVHVKDVIKVSSINLSSNTKEITAGQSFQLSATVLPSNATNKSVAWSSSNTSVATVSTNGLVTGVSVGSAVITCAAQDGSGVKATCSVTVKAPTVLVSQITLNESNKELKKNETFQLTATVVPSNATNKSVTWSSSNTSVATVSTNGLVTAVGEGNATITCTAQDGSGVKATCNVAVKSNVLITQISIPSSRSVTPNGTATLTPTITPSNATNQSLKWSSSDNSIATVNTSVRDKKVA